MRITRLYLRNYRVFEDPVEIELPPGLVGLFGPNGAGKSTLLESILWALWGRARTSKDGIRTSDVNSECVTEVEFEHEGHLYLVRRTISGINHTVRAQAHADGSQVAEGVRDVGTYVHSVLGMDDVAFRASVFAEQKQLAAFSSHAPAERRKLVMQLLGITPIDGARDQARRDAREATERVTRTRALLPDRAAIQEELGRSERAAAAAAAGSATATEQARSARAVLEATEEAHRRLVDVGREYDALVRDGKAAREQRDGAAGRVERLEAELRELSGAEERLAALDPVAQALTGAEQQLHLTESALATARALGQLPTTEPPPVPDAGPCDAARVAADAERARLSETEGRLAAARAGLEGARQAADRSSSLSGAADCPLCGQSLDAAFEQVQAHRAAELAAAEAAVAELTGARDQAAVAAKAAVAAADAAGRQLEAARQRWSEHERDAERRSAALAAYQAALGALPATFDAGPDPVGALDAERGRLAEAVRAGREALAECGRLRGRLERREAAAAELVGERERVVELDSQLENLRDKVRALAFSPEELARAANGAEEARRAFEAATAESQRLSAEAAAAAATVEERRRRLADAEEQHARLAGEEEEARHLGRVSDLLSSFRNAVVASVGPRLSAQAADLFAELTDHEYDTLQVDPDTYEIQIVDKAVAYGMDRFSGSETDLANLALRVAISEHVRFQSGGAVGLLVLDEVFGPLDEDRKARMLLALERLRGRFRQVLVVTHDPAIKEQLPLALQVIPTGKRRATARVL